MRPHNDMGNTSMDTSNRGWLWARSEVSELLDGGLILWRLSSASQAAIWCLVFKTTEGFCFVLDDDPKGHQPYRLCERHTDVVVLLDRAESLKHGLVARGWREADVD